MTISYSKLKSLLNKPHAKRFELADRDGLSVRVTQTGSISFQYRYRFQTIAKRLTLGRFPDLTLAQARDKIPELRQLLNNGKDPIVELKRLITPSGASIDDCIYAFIDRHVSKLRKNTQNLYCYTLKRHAIGAFDFPVEDVTIREWYNYFDKIEDEYTEITAQDILVRLKTCMRFCIKRNIISSSTILMIAPKDVGKASEIGDRVVSPKEVLVIWKALNQSKCYPTTKNAIKLAILTGARLGEIRHMEACDIDLNTKLWTIPKAKSKTNKKFVRPLAPEALKIIKWQIETFGDLTHFVFPSGSYNRHISPQTINKLSRSIVKNMEMERWSCHDFRRSLSTILSSKKVELHVTEKMLGHSLGGILAVYNKHEWLEEQREAYELWETILFQAMN
ncbi:MULTISPECIES: site-specific integrase [unclassified Colwellia]|uniref:tyrosine-type recombinase/integrase n=1 Tax=unclassified Colwellia TaxID=196834 RepID=UPI0015F5505A|nr:MULTISPECIES: site-specific integrase [unclassified Colwellia]MBA6356801.1 site-specific integrase [Colwellia sp. BRX8-3]MBA6360339.1 site-specific integrase [Colwellia sp. BRX8-6]MBA6367544.1 site-specific integrase [Colwellia sp. BRX8-5]MBA6376924.1 site-specific integrase [Colwellia sp. BRX8-2]